MRGHLLNLWPNLHDGLLRGLHDGDGHSFCRRQSEEMDDEEESSQREHGRDTHGEERGNSSIISPRLVRCMPLLYDRPMSMRSLLLLMSFTCLVAACTGVQKKGSASFPILRDSAMISDATLASMRYTIIDAHVRSKLRQAGRNFDVQLQGGLYDFPEAFRMKPFDHVRLHAEPRVRGDMDGDGVDDVVVVLQIGDGETSVSELAMLATHSGSVHQMASFSLGHATVTSLAISHLSLRVNAIETFVPGTASRSAVFTFRLPESVMVGSGAVRKK